MLLPQKSESEGKLPLNVINDGTRLESNLEMLELSNENLDELLVKHNIKEEDVLIATIDEHDNFIYQLKEEEQK